MDYLGVIKKSWEYVARYKYLWLLGILSGGFSFNTGSSYQYNGGDSSDKIQNITSGDTTALLNTMQNSAKAEVTSVGKALGESIGPGAFENVWIWIAIAFVVLLVLLLCIYLSITAKSAIVWSLSELDGGREVTLKDSWRSGHKLFWRRLSLAIIMSALIIIPLAVLAIPVVTLAIFEVVIPAIILGLIFGLVFIVYVIYLALIFPYSERLLVINKLSAIKSLYGAKDLFAKKWREIVVMYLIVFGISLAAMIAVAIALFSVIIILGMPVLIVYFISKIASFALGGLFVLAILVAMLVISGALNAFTSSCVTLTYNRIK
jgi:hypothetical protein